MNTANRHLRNTFAITSALLILMAGCAGDDSLTTAPQGLEQSVTAQSVAGPRLFTPLAEGNRWRYDVTFRLEIIPLNGTMFATAEVRNGVIEKEIIGTEERFEREYILQELMYYAESAQDTVYRWDRFRQDSAGLYRANVPGSVPPDVEASSGRLARTVGSPRNALVPGFGEIVAAIDRPLSPGIRRALDEHLRRLRRINTLLDSGVGFSTAVPGRSDGVLPNESQWLAYPLSAGSQWLVREEPFLVNAVVEALETLDLPIGPATAYRVRIDNELMGPYDSVLQWHSRCGWLGFFSHLETLAMDILTGEIVLILTEETQWLADIDINEGSCGSRRD